jgi:hypothetical protein
MGAKHTTIGFHSDDYGFLYNGSYKSTSDIKRIFSNGDMIDNANSMFDYETPQKKSSFTEALYRPLLLILMGTERALFGLNAYKFHLVHTALHTCVTLTLFNVIAILSSPLAALPVALFFGLHTSLKDYFFWQCYIQNTLEAALLCYLIFLFIIWRKRQSMVALGISLVLFFIALLLRETLLILPAIAGFWLFLERMNPESKSGIHFKYNQLLSALKTSLLFSISILGYFLLRLWAHPFSISTSKLGIKHFSNEQKGLLLTAQGKFFDLLTWLIDLIGLKWLPAKSSCIKLFALTVLTAFIFYTWRKNPYKKLLLISATCCLFFSWPSILLVHCSRYLYLPALFFAFFIGLLAASLTRKNLIFFILIGLSYASVQGFITNQRLTKWVNQTAIETSYIQQLINYSNNGNHTIAIGHPLRLVGTGTPAALQLKGIKDASSYSLILPFYDAWEFGDTGTLNYKLNNQQLTISSSTPETLWIPLQAISPLRNIGTYTINNQQTDKVYSLTLKLDADTLKNNQLICWNTLKKCFERI